MNINVNQSYEPLSKDNIKDHWLQIKNLPDEQHAHVFSRENNVNLKDFILDINKQIAFELLERNKNLKRANMIDIKLLQNKFIINQEVEVLLMEKMLEKEIL